MAELHKSRLFVISGGSYASSNDPRIHFGLGPATKVDGVEIHWPSKLVEHISLPAAVDRFYEVQEGKGVIPSAYDSPPTG